VGAEDFARWIGAVQAIKPEAEMPSYDHLTGEELAALATYLEGLK
jgi:cytochrome c oxidase subunit 2